MVEILNEIIEKDAQMVLVPKYEPEIIGYGDTPRIVYDEIVIPTSLQSRFLERCGVTGFIPDDHLHRYDIAKRIAGANSKKDIYVRFADEKPLSIVTGKFREIKPSQLAAEASEIMHNQPLVRYFKNNESLQMNFPLDDRFPGLHLFMNTGNYGIYGGSGRQAVHYGISWYNKTCSNWTIFLRESLKEYMKEKKGRIVHLYNAKPEESISQLVNVSSLIGEAVESSHDKLFGYDELDAYFKMYEPKGLNKGIADTVMIENPSGASAYDVSYRLTELCQDPKLSDVTRARIEYMAGEMILSYDKIMEATTFRMKNPHLFDKARQN